MLVSNVLPSAVFVFPCGFGVLGKSVAGNRAKSSGIVRQKKTTKNLNNGHTLITLNKRNRNVSMPVLLRPFCIGLLFLGAWQETESPLGEKI